MKLQVVGKGGVLKEFQLNEGENLIGRKDPEQSFAPAIDLDEFDTDSKVSRLHARIMIANNQAYLEDLDSLNGTYLQGSKEKLSLGNKAHLKSGDQFLIGSIVLKLGNTN